MTRRLYLDSAASAPLSQRVRQAMIDWYAQDTGNPSSPHRDGQRARIRVEETHDAVAAALHAQSREIVFTSGGTEANNQALWGPLRALDTNGRHIISTQVEHPSVLRPLEALREQGYEVTLIKPDSRGALSANAVAEALRPDTVLVSMMWVNNETGIIHPVKEVGRLLKDHPALWHTDAVQAFGKLDTDIEEAGCDLLTFSAHKIHGPKGVGGLYLKHGTPFRPLLTGGGQEANRRAGTENTGGLTGLKAALDAFLPQRRKHYDHVRNLQRRFEEGITAMVPEAHIWGADIERSPYITALALPGYDNQSLLLNLDMAGVSVSVGSACSSGSINASHVIRAISDDPALINGTIRVSYHPGLSMADVEEALNRFESVLKRQEAWKKTK
ncbi:MAG: cysteine desulfurase [Calditrichaeota bacterium]|nr:MAG: cysteine desulfurase [Calditrichota bacterium]